MPNPPTTQAQWQVGVVSSLGGLDRIRTGNFRCRRGWGYRLPPQAQVLARDINKTPVRFSQGVLL